MTEEDIKKLGFKLAKRYTHDEYNTNRYTKGPLDIEFTYEGSLLVDTDLTIAEVNCAIVTLTELRALTQILGKL